MAKATYAYLLKDADVKRWYENVTRGLRVTADVYLRKLGWVCKHLNLKPKELLGKSEKEPGILLADLVAYLECEGKAGHQYFTFLGEEGCEYLKDYLESRLKEGEKLMPDSPVLTPKGAPFKHETLIGN
ncbi:MAG: hypothetical protein NWF09_05580 [Candidatus Bathyarchaeota archaeon]|nr:hypothetical protein [Candidatus Bathyarchaeota archaeon]